MYPFITEGNLCRFVPFHVTEVAVGDVVLFAGDKGVLVGHRIIKLSVTPSDEPAFLVKGDTNVFPDGWLTPSRIIGRLTLVVKGRRNVRVDGVWCRMYGRAVAKAPLVTWGLRFYLRQRTRVKRIISTVTNNR